jgi:beta-galactosidase
MKHLKTPFLLCFWSAMILYGIRIEAQQPIAGFAESDHLHANQMFRGAFIGERQQRIRTEQPVFAAVVYWDPGAYDRDHMRSEFKRMLEAGFTAVRFHNCMPVWHDDGSFDFSRADDWLNSAEEAGIDVVYHLPRLEQVVPDAVLKRAGVSREEMLYTNWSKKESCRKIADTFYRTVLERYKDHPALYAYGMYGEPGSNMAQYGDPVQLEAFKGWLSDQYSDVHAVEAAWNLYPGDTLVYDLDKAVELSINPNRHLGYGVNRDRTRFVSDVTIARTSYIYDLCRGIDPDHYYFIGSHQLLYNQAALGWDHDRWADIGDIHFCSLHLSWHFEPVWGEVDRPAYMMARLTQDYKKGGWTSCFETTGGAVQYSGGYGNSMSADLMRRLILYYLASGNRSIAFWTWNHRPGGWEAGEYGMTTWSGKVTPWAREAGRIAQAMLKYKDEIWNADQEDPVGVLVNWDNEALFLNEPTRYELNHGLSDFVTGAKVMPVRGMIGISRALINNHVPYEYVSIADLQAGIGARYKTIYAPHMRGISAEAIESLTGYVRSGGRLVADVQFAFSDQWGKMHPRGPGTQVEHLFGAWVDLIHDNRTGRKAFEGTELPGFYGDIEVTDATVLEQFDDGGPAITSSRLGRGESVLIGFDASMMCFEPGDHPRTENMLAGLVRAGSENDWSCNAPMAFRRVAPDADHYFLFNDGGDPLSVTLSAGKTYTEVEDVIEGRKLNAGQPDIVLQPGTSIWLRCR